MASYITIFIMLALATVAKCAPYLDYTFEIPEECNDKELCNIAPYNYPYDFFNDYVISMQKKDFMRSPQYFGERVETINYDKDNCNTREFIDLPFISRSNGTAKLVIQTKYYNQKVKQTECLTQDQQCFGQMFNYKATCSTTYGSMKLYVFNTGTKQFEYETVNIGVCCTCSIV